MAGIAVWINGYFRLKDENKINKNDQRILPIKKWIDKEYEKGRISNIKNEELYDLTLKYIPDILDNKKTRVI